MAWFCLLARSARDQHSTAADRNLTSFKPYAVQAPALALPTFDASSWAPASSAARERHQLLPALSQRPRPRSGTLGEPSSSVYPQVCVLHLHVLCASRPVLQACPSYNLSQATG